MPRERWSYAFPIGYVSFIVVANILSNAGLLSEYTVLQLLLAMICLGVLTKWYLRKAKAAGITAAGLAVDTEPVIPYAYIDRIISEGGGFPSVVFSDKGRREFHIEGKDYVKLARTSLNRWDIKGEKVTLTPGDAGQYPVIEYSRLGKYATYRLDMPKMWLFYLALFFFVIGFAAPDGDEFVLAGDLGAGVAVLIIVLELTIPIFKKVQLSVVGDRIILTDENLREHVLRFADIIAVEKGLFRIKVTAKNGEILYFPRGFVLLPELIEELAGPLANRK